MNGKVITAGGPVEPGTLGRVLMHEHLHSDIYDWENEELIQEEKPITAERRDFLMREAIPPLKKCNEHGCHAVVDVTMEPWRAWPTFYPEASDAADMNLILSTGAYREMEMGTYWVKKPEDAIWPIIRESSVEELAERFTRELLEGLHGTNVRAGAIKLGSSAKDLTEIETKAFRAGARAQQTSGVHITTHCGRRGGFGGDVAQLRLLTEEGVDPERIVIGHTAPELMDEEHRKVCIEWMRRGANFLPTNLRIDGDEGPAKYRPLIDAIHETFDAGLGEHIVFGLDCAFASESRPFQYEIIPPPPYLYMFTHTLPAFRELGLTEEEEETIMAKNPQRILPVRT